MGLGMGADDCRAPAPSSSEVIVPRRRGAARGAARQPARRRRLRRCRRSPSCARAPPTRSTKTLRGAGMIIDGWIMPEDVSITFANGKQNAVDVIAGFNKDEHTSLGGNVAVPRHDGVAHAPVRREAGGARQEGYWYTFTHEPPIEPGAAT